MLGVEKDIADQRCVVCGLCGHMRPPLGLGGLCGHMRPPRGLGGLCGPCARLHARPPTIKRTLKFSEIMIVLLLLSLLVFDFDWFYLQMHG